MRRMKLHSTTILKNENAKNELIYSFLCECERLFGGWMGDWGFDYTDVRVNVFKHDKMTFFGELMELLFGEFKWKKGFFPTLKIPAHIFRPIMRRNYHDKKLAYFNKSSYKRFFIQKL